MITQPRVVSHAEWITARTPFLLKEKEFTRLRDQLSQQRRDLPWERVDKPYAFEGPEGRETLPELFDGRSAAGSRAGSGPNTSGPKGCCRP